MHLLLSTVCVSSVHQVFCLITRALQPHYETLNGKLASTVCVCVCVYRAPHKEATAAGFEPARPFVT